MGVLTALLTIPMGLLALQVAPADPQQDLVLLLAPAGKSGVDVLALMDAVTTYTRDLRVRVQLVRVGELGGGARDAAVGLVRARAARLAFWCTPGGETGSLVVHVVDARGDTRSDVVGAATPGSGSGTADLHRAVALKLRAVLAGDTASEPASADRVAGRAGESARERQQAAAAAAPVASSVAPARVVAPPSPPAGPSAAEERAPGTSSPSPPSAATDATATDRAPPRAILDAHAQPFRWGGLFASAGYGLALTSGNAPLRQGLALHGTAALAAPIELDAGVEWAPSSQRTIDAGALTLRDIPIRLGGRFVRRGPRLLMGLGPFGAAHVLSASARSPAGRQDGTTAAGGFGLEAVARGALGGGLSWEIRLWAERLVPRTRFLVGGQPAWDTGAVTLGLGAGVAFPTR